MLGEHAWVAPRAADEVNAVLVGAAVEYERFGAAHAAGSPGAAEVVGRAWNLAEIARAYQDFVTAQRPLVTAVTARSPDEEAYAARFGLVHAWRSLEFRDPQLPAALLPSPWPGAGATSFFDKHATRLRPAADRYVERCLASVTRGGRMGFSEP